MKEYSDLEKFDKPVLKNYDGNGKYFYHDSRFWNTI